MTRLDCNHCETKGICITNSGSSCGTCLKKAKTKNAQIVRCEVCEGAGTFEPFSSRLNTRLPFIIVFVVLMVFYLYTGSSLGDNEKFDQIFPLISSLTTMIVTFYFARK